MLLTRDVCSFEMRSVLLLLFVECLCITVSSGQDFPFRNISKSWEERVDDLVARLTLEEVVLQISRGGEEAGGPAPAIPRLGIKAYAWNTECLRGDVQAGNATAFPQAIGLAATFDADLVQRVAEATGEEVRAKFYIYQRHGQVGDHKGLSCFSPVINIMRHPLWGRNQETYGECPILSGTLARAFVQGLQGDDPRYIQANAGCKHFNVHGGPDNFPVSRFSFNAKVSLRDWHSTFLPQFKSCVDAGSWSLMCSYNRINGIPACANGYLLNEVLRKRWGFKGYVISDEEALEFMISGHHFFDEPVAAAKAALEAGCNLELSTNRTVDAVFASVVKGVKTGRIKEELVRERLKPLFMTRMRLGEFDPPDKNPYSNIRITDRDILSQRHLRLAKIAAMKSFVLLKNRKVSLTLPLRKNALEIAVIGPMSDSASEIFGDYAPEPPKSFVKTPWDVLRYVSERATLIPGCDSTRCSKAEFHPETIKNYFKNTKPNVIVLCLGTGQSVESEGRDRRDLELPGQQARILEMVVDYSRQHPHTGVLLLLFAAGPLNISLAVDDDAVDAILFCFFPAQATGEALLSFLTGNSVPAGRLPFTWPRHLSDVPPITDYAMTNRTYRYAVAEPLFPFGFGLSFDDFRYFNPTANTSTIGGVSDEGVEISVAVENEGWMKGEEIMHLARYNTNSSCCGGPDVPPPPKHAVATSGSQDSILDPSKSKTWRVLHDDYGIDGRKSKTSKVSKASKSSRARSINSRREKRRERRLEGEKSRDGVGSLGRREGRRDKEKEDRHFVAGEGDLKAVSQNPYNSLSKLKIGATNQDGVAQTEFEDEFEDLSSEEIEAQIDQLPVEILCDAETTVSALVANAENIVMTRMVTMKERDGEARKLSLKNVNDSCGGAPEKPPPKPKKKKPANEEDNLSVSHSEPEISVMTDEERAAEDARLAAEAEEARRRAAAEALKRQGMGAGKGAGGFGALGPGYIKRDGARTGLPKAKEFKDALVSGGLGREGHSGVGMKGAGTLVDASGQPVTKETMQTLQIGPDTRPLSATGQGKGQQMGDGRGGAMEDVGGGPGGRRGMRGGPGDMGGEMSGGVAGGPYGGMGGGRGGGAGGTAGVGPGEVGGGPGGGPGGIGSSQGGGGGGMGGGPGGMASDQGGMGGGIGSGPGGVGDPGRMGGGPGGMGGGPGGGPGGIGSSQGGGGGGMGGGPGGMASGQGGMGGGIGSGPGGVGGGPRGMGGGPGVGGPGVGGPGGIAGGPGAGQRGMGAGPGGGPYGSPGAGPGYGPGGVGGGPRGGPGGMGGGYGVAGASGGVGDGRGMAYPGAGGAAMGPGGMGYPGAPGGAGQGMGHPGAGAMEHGREAQGSGRPGSIGPGGVYRGGMGHPGGGFGPAQPGQSGTRVGGSEVSGHAELGRPHSGVGVGVTRLHSGVGIARSDLMQSVEGQGTVMLPDGRRVPAEYADVGIEFGQGFDGEGGGYGMTQDGQEIPEWMRAQDEPEWTPGTGPRWKTSISYPPTHYDWGEFFRTGKFLQRDSLLSAVESWSYYAFDSERFKRLHYDSNFSHTYDMLETETLVPREVISMAIVVAVCWIIAIHGDAEGGAEMVFVLCAIYPIYQTISMISGHYTPEELDHWIGYWISYYLLCVEPAAYDFLTYWWMPFRQLVKAGILVWIMLPRRYRPPRRQLPSPSMALARTMYAVKMFREHWAMELIEEAEEALLRIFPKSKGPPPDPNKPGIRGLDTLCNALLMSCFYVYLEHFH